MGIDILASPKQPEASETLINLRYPLLESLLAVLEGEPECDALYAVEHLNAFASAFFSARKNDPLRIIASRGEISNPPASPDTPQ